MILLDAAIGRMRLLGDIFEPIVNMLRPLPPPVKSRPIALLFAGAGDGGKIAMIVFTCSFPILIGSIDGVRANHPMLTNVARPAPVLSRNNCADRPCFRRCRSS